VIDPRIRSAARNNAEWCEAVSSARGTPGEFDDGIWFNRHPVPRYYPNAVTLHETAHHDTGHVLDHIRELANARLPGAWAVKDSFGLLDLASSGFAPLFDAQWIVHNPDVPLGNYPLPNWRWTTIDSVAGLDDWEAAWSVASGELPGQPRVFAPALLENRRVAVVAAFEGDRIVAGAIANRSNDVVGLSNPFSPQSSELASAARVLSLLSELFPRMPVVGYANGAELKGSVRLGYEPIGRLRVWIKRGFA
jgi:hypothetical protein